MMGAMKAALFVGSLSDADRQRLDSGLRSRDAIELRRCQILLASADGQRPSQIAAHVGCTPQAVRNTIRSFHTTSTECLRPKRPGPKNAVPILDDLKCERLRAIVHERPRAFGKATSLWTLRLLAEVCLEQGVTPHALSIESIRRAFKRMGVSWKRAKRWITSPDPRYAIKKSSPCGVPHPL
jgi:transposase